VAAGTQGPTGLDPAVARVTAERILSASTQLTRLVADLVDFDRLRRGHIAVQPEVLDLVPILQDVVAGFHEQPGGERVVCVLPPQLPARADRARVVQVVTNLVDNALKYAPHGPVILREGEQPRAKTPLSSPSDTTPGPGTAPGMDPGSSGSAAAAAAAAAGLVRVAVEDQGSGVAPADAPRVWEKFYRGRGVAELNIARGTGIGLAVVKALVEEQGGQVGLERAPGGGACFWFALPGIGVAPGSAVAPVSSRASADAEHRLPRLAE
jgi:signal transduction histidine kinase